MNHIASEKLNFLHKAIEDTQQTIRFVDTKISIILLLFGIFVSIIGAGLPSFSEYFWNMRACLQTIFIIATSLFIICIGIALFLTIKIIFPRSNPSEHITMEYKPMGFFYLSDLKTSWKDGFVDRKCVILKPSFEDYLLKFTEIIDSQAIEKELIYEFLKVSYIREIKIRRIKYAVRWIWGSLVLSLILVYLHYIGLSFYMPKD